MTAIEQFLEEHKAEFAPWLLKNEQGRIDLKILPYLKDIEKGFFVEAGALDGLFMSNTTLLEGLGWSGLLVEPSKAAYENCLKNRGCYVANCALVSQHFKGDFIYGDFFYDGFEGRGAWSSVNRNHYAKMERVRTPAHTLQRLLDQINVTHVDLLSLDVEGYEINVIKGIDFDKTDITHILVEVNLSNYDLEDMDELLGKNGYERIANLSNFTREANPKWDGLHQDYLYAKS